MKKPYTFKAKLWIYPGDTANWHFLTVPKELATTIKKNHGANARGFGSLPVEVTTGNTTWKTSIFPDSKAGTYFLPIKAKVRKTEDLQADDVVQCKIIVGV